ncbi:MAG: cell division protein ZapA [Serpentinimonas sp.]|nr:cell division protein ZapA [Serpentinimonas sp.]
MNKPGIKQIEVQIMGQSYLLACPVDGEGALMDAVAKVDSAMCRIRDAGKVKARDRIAVLASLNIAFELLQKDALSFRASSFGQTEAEPAPAPAAAAPSATLPQAEEAQLKSLLSRLDAALANDGQLI